MGEVDPTTVLVVEVKVVMVSVVLRDANTTAAVAQEKGLRLNEVVPEGATGDPTLKKSLPRSPRLPIPPLLKANPRSQQRLLKLPLMMKRPTKLLRLPKRRKTTK